MAGLRVKSFPPVASSRPRVLVLGSMPGVASLKARQYYAHPQNVFWPVMGGLFGAPVDTYAQRLALVHENALAVWDVLKHCERPGSLDSAIVDRTAVVNDFNGFLKKHRGIRHVFFNGAKAETAFCRHVLPRLQPEVVARLQLERLPSTSPAHAGMPMADKKKAWATVRRAVKSGQGLQL